MNGDDQKILNILLRENYITEIDAKKAIEALKVSKISLIDYLTNSQVINKSLLGQAIAESFGVTFSDLETNPPSQEQVLRIPQEQAKKYLVVLVEDQSNRVIIATSNPKQDGLVVYLQQVFPGKSIVINYAFPKDIENSYIHYRDSLINRLTKILQNPAQGAVEIIEEILKESSIDRASDIHFEPQENFVIIRFRVDGVLHEVGRIDKVLYENILNRFKILAHLRIDEHNTPQDGAARFSKEGVNMDLRLSIVPTLDGEKIAIRILSEYVRDFTLTDIGLLPANQKMLLESAKKPFGMILVTGPTGSGKTTTLYALLKLLNRPDINVTTIEDPVEYKIPGINQIQVNAATNLTFAAGLKSIVRQDPNIILIGEIRDPETMDISVNAALTGHLLLSTFHANDASTAIPRLLEMGAEPFLVASTLELLIAQRLVRKICDVCKFSQTYTKDYLHKIVPLLNGFLNDESITLYRGKGCSNCGGTGYKGRVALFEFIKISLKMQDLILKNPSSKLVWELAKTEGSKSLFEDGLEKVQSGTTTLEELLRVAQP
jgi:type II secretory ATPase GspE/PulE/Tfp pilus assembly ATPase PilB-like protein